MVRRALVVVAVVLAAWLGAIQLASSAAYGDLAVRPSLPTILHASAPALLRPLLGGRRARAAAAVHEGDVKGAERLLAGVRDDAETADLRGRIAEARGDRAAAIDEYVRAGDVLRAQTLIDGLGVRDLPRAVADQQRLVAALRDDPNAAEVMGEAWWRLGQLEAGAGYRDPTARARYWRDAEASYERALELAPNEETYLLAAGYQSMANGDYAASLRYYQHAAEVVPNSLDAYLGLAWSASMHNDCASARRYFARARELHAMQAVIDGVRPFANPIAGERLRRCLI
ncbi:MAG TPA: hypothetical protein VHS78_19150 [Candidatus Elarobacter sp.]|jgi:tetratricopeptide (TPR) repeat protein|nr:hypothetical protein [Candidatus Elarobacter sp.]